MSFDVFTLGETMLRLSAPAGTSLTRAGNLDVHIGGAEANVATALSSLGRSVAWMSRLPTNDLGRRVVRDLVVEGVDTSHVGWEDSGRLGTYFVELGAGPKGVSVIYDRRDSAAAAMSASDLPIEDMSSARLVHLTGITPALSPSCREMTEATAVAVRDADSLLSVDINYRSKLWSEEEAVQCLSGIATGADLVVCTREDARDLFALEGGPAGVAASLADRLESTFTVVTDGENGAVCWHDSDVVAVAATPTRIVDRLGAGDAFTAGVIDGLLDGEIEEGLRRGSMLAAAALATRGDQVALTRSELTRLLETRGRRLDR